ncbi:hypothetical protein LPJ77_000843 [Coemansia sp. RSA 2523]|nr:hypothetical protein LPJ54_000365 [Coemansia sp. RSA 1824]KAJ1810514.1 hypothetical protein LPJ77_000843 [Coemansia sp. RSA 2523]KAJ2178404.1 hypothetical protein EV181_006227 [Coemansia sp. RSA 532]KAJ2193325.1 hypothetical protein IW144_004496 [Coemansia sp. RSA 522]KAJ2205569.1 hypothetical protein IW145_002717 [Coemansia sp. RSA 521]KAJ2212677.1 hypothetical protein IW143_003884 [Coemansia sp. RSA 520]KAJ2257379.1 hypothetical protein GGH98_000872 [Coemansia sp. RSA 454]KAJ2294775.1 h
MVGLTRRSGSSTWRFPLRVESLKPRHHIVHASMQDGIDRLAMYLRTEEEANRTSSEYAAGRTDSIIALYTETSDTETSSTESSSTESSTTASNGSNPKSSTDASGLLDAVSMQSESPESTHTRTEVAEIAAERDELERLLAECVNTSEEMSLRHERAQQELSYECQTLRAELRGVRAESEKLQGVYAENTRLQSCQKDLKAENARLLVEHCESLERTHKLEDENTRLQSIQKDMEADNAHLQMHQTEIETENAQLQNIQKDLKTENARLQELVQMLQGDVSVAEQRNMQIKQHAQQTVAKANAEITRLRNCVSQAHTDAAAMQIRTAQTSTRAKALHAQLAPSKLPHAHKKPSY